MQPGRFWCSVSVSWDLAEQSVLPCLTRGRQARNSERLACRPRVKHNTVQKVAEQRELPGVCQ